MSEQLSAEEALIQRAEDACRPCGPCDSGLPMGCSCDPEPRAVIAGLLDVLASRHARLAAVEALADEWERAERDGGQRNYAGSLFGTAARELRAALRPDPSEAGA